MILAFLAGNWRILAISTAACALCFMLGDCRGEKRGKALERAAWTEQSNRILRAAERMRNAADVLAAQREATNATQIKELRDAAAKGDDTAAGPGVRAVIERLRAQGR